MTEQWRDIDGFPPYQVSDRGRVRRLQRYRPPRILTPNTVRGGYSVVRLQREGSQHNLMVHRLVAQAFIGPIPAGHEVHHRDFQPANNALQNLEVVTPRQNVQYTIEAGRADYARGEAQGHARYREPQVAAAKALLGTGLSQRRVSELVRMSYDSVRKIAQGRQWTHVNTY